MGKESSNGITPRQAIDPGTEIQRHCSPFIAGLLEKQHVSTLQSNPRWLDRWTISALLLRLHGVRIGLHPEDADRPDLLARIEEVSRDGRLRDKILYDREHMNVTVTVVSKSHLITPDTQTWFWLLVEENPLNPARLEYPGVFWVKPSQGQEAFVKALVRLVTR